MGQLRPSGDPRDGEDQEGDEEVGDGCSKVDLLAVTEVSAWLPLCPGSYMSSCHTVPGGGPRR
jgi:hypothetical protein